MLSNTLGRVNHVLIFKLRYQFSEQSIKWIVLRYIVIINLNKMYHLVSKVMMKLKLTCESNLKTEIKIKTQKLWLHNFQTLLSYHTVLQINNNENKKVIQHPLCNIIAISFKELLIL